MKTDSDILHWIEQFYGLIMQTQIYKFILFRLKLIEPFTKSVPFKNYFKIISY